MPQMGEGRSSAQASPFFDGPRALGNLLRTVFSVEGWLQVEPVTRAKPHVMRLCATAYGKRAGILRARRSAT